MQYGRLSGAGQPLRILPSLFLLATASRQVFTVCCVSLVATLAAICASAQDEKPDTSTAFLTGGPVDLADLLAACAAFYELPLEIDRSKISGKVTIRSGPGFSKDELWALANRELAQNQLACIQPSGEKTLAVVPIAQAAKLARTEDGPVAAARAGFVKVLEPVTTIEPAKAAEILLKVLSVEGSVVQPVGERLLIAGLKPQVQEALELLWTIDKTGAGASVEIVPVRNLPPASLVALIERIKTALATAGDAPKGTLLANPASSSLIVVAPEADLQRWKDLVQQFDVAEARVTRNYVPHRFGLQETAKLIEAVVRGGRDPAAPADGWKLVQDELTGTLVVTASYSSQVEIQELLDRVETTQVDARRAMRAFAVKHRKVGEMVKLLDELLANAPLPTTETAPPAPATQNTPAQAAEATLKPEEPKGGTGGRAARQPTAMDLSLGMDEGTNRILAIGPPKSLDDLGKLIEQLDEQEPQVLVETMIVILTDSESRDLTIELQKIGEKNGTLWQLASLFGAGSPDPNQSALAPATGTGVSGVILDPGSFSGALRALQTINHGRTLTVPKVLVNNHETAHLDSVLQSPYTTSNTSTNLASISFGGTLDAGTTVDVTPQITEGDQLLLDYSVSLSSFVGASSNPSLPPPRQQNKLASVASIPDGYCVVVGGLEVDSDTKADSRVPILGSIPLLGALFKSQTKTESKSRFYVFLRASVLRSTDYEDLRYASAPAMATAGVGDDLPVVEPRIIR